MENRTENKEHVISLDVGTSKVCMLLGVEDDNGKLIVKELASVKSNGVVKGSISNIDKTMSDIKKCYGLVTKNHSYNISKVHIGISGQHVDSIEHKDVILRENNLDVITSEDINQLVAKVYKFILPPGHQIVHILPQDFTIDNVENITDPIGMVGNKIEGEFHILTRKESDCKHVKKCVVGADLNLGSMVLTPLASSMAVLREDEKKFGVCVLDIGESTTDIVIYKDDVVRFVDVIPFGGDIITRDIYQECSVLPDFAKNLKEVYGSALVSEIKDSRLLSFDGFNSRDKRKISEVNLAHIIESRMNDIIDFALKKIIDSGYSKDLLNGIVLTGGGALLKDLDKSVELRSGLPVRIGLPIYHLAPGGYASKLSDPTYAAVIGLAINAIHNNYNLVEKESTNYRDEIEDAPTSLGMEKAKSFFRKIYNGIIDFFTEVEDVDFKNNKI